MVRMDTEQAPRSGADEVVDTVLAVAQGLDLRAALQRCLDAAMSLTGARYGAVGVLGVGGELQEFLHAGISEEQRSRIGPLPTGLGVLGLMDDGGAAVRLVDIAAHPESVGFPRHHPPMTTLLGAPIVVRGDLYGKLYVADKGADERAGTGGGAARPFTDHDERVVVALAASAGVAVENARLFETTRQRERWQSAVTSIDAAVLADSDPGDVLELIAGEARRLSGADIAVLALPDSKRRLVIEVVDVRDLDAEPHDPVDDWSVDRSRRRESGPAPDPIGARSWLGRVVPADSLLSGVLEEKQTMVAPAPDFLGALHLGLGTTVALPLHASQRGLGVLALIWDHETDRFAREGLEVAETFAAQAAVTLMLAESRREHESLLIYQDRDRIARDRHDLVVQRVFATGMSLQATTRMPGVPGPVVERLDRAVDELNETIREIRQTIFELQSAESAGIGTRSRVLREVAQATALLGFQPTIRFLGPVDTLVVDAVADHVVAAVREGLSNAARHSRATAVEVTVEVGQGEVRLAVVDDGQGLDPGVRRRSGLKNIRARAAALGGQASVINDPRQGTRLEFRAPLG